jgi:hypothetical protein
MDEKLTAAEAVDATILRGAGMTEHAEAHGFYTVECIRNGEVIWTDIIPNTVVTVGKNLALDTYLAGSSYTVVGPFMGLISSTSFSAIAAADTMASHAGWLEAGGANAPTYSGTRKTAAWSLGIGRLQGSVRGAPLCDHRQRHRQGRLPGVRHRRPEHDR